MAKRLIMIIGLYSHARYLSNAEGSHSNLVKKGKSSDDDEAKRRLEQTVSAFNSALMGSFAALKRADIAQLGKMSPDEFATKYCSSPLGVFDIKIKKLEIRKEKKLVFFGLAERRLEF